MVLNSTRGEILLQILSIQIKDVITYVTTKKIYRTITVSLFHNNKSDYFKAVELEIYYFFVISYSPIFLSIIRLQSLMYVVIFQTCFVQGYLKKMMQSIEYWLAYHPMLVLIRLLDSILN